MNLKRVLNQIIPWSTGFALLIAHLCSTIARAQEKPPANSSNQSSAAPIHLSLEDAIKRAKALSPTLIAAFTNAKVAAENTTQARSSLLPNVTGNTQYLYTEGNGTPGSPFHCK